MHIMDSERALSLCPLIDETVGSNTCVFKDFEAVVWHFGVKFAAGTIWHYPRCTSQLPRELLRTTHNSSTSPSTLLIFIDVAPTPARNFNQTVPHFLIGHKNNGGGLSFFWFAYEMRYELLRDERAREDVAWPPGPRRLEVGTVITSG